MLNFSGEGVVLHIARYMREKEFCGKARNDWIWVRSHMVSGKAQPNLLNGRIPRRLNLLFKITSRGTVYRLAHVTLLQYVGDAVVQGAEEMLCIRLLTLADNVMVGIAKIRSIAHLIPVEPGES